MKKEFFTAIVMIVFSSASMANTIADEEIIKEEKKMINDLKKIKELDDQGNIWDCLEVYTAYYNYFNSYFNYSSPDLARELASGHFQNCMYGSEGGSVRGVLC